MISKIQMKLIRSLAVKKFRESEKLFVAEGEKIAKEFLNSSASIHSLYATSEWFAENAQYGSRNNFYEVGDNDLKKISSLDNPNKVLIVANLPQPEFKIDGLAGKLTLVLDDIRDPGNLGTIVRTADWFGIKNIICSENTVDVFNSKVVQSTMGSLLRVTVFYKELKEVLPAIKMKTELPFYAAVLDGENIAQKKTEPNGILLIGNESRGVSKELLDLADFRISIPRAAHGTAESLNAGVAASILCYEIMKTGA